MQHRVEPDCELLGRCKACCLVYLHSQRLKVHQQTGKASGVLERERCHPVLVLAAQGCLGQPHASEHARMWRQCDCQTVEVAAASGVYLPGSSESQFRCHTQTQICRHGWWVTGSAEKSSDDRSEDGPTQQSLPPLVIGGMPTNPVIVAASAGRMER